MHVIRVNKKKLYLTLDSNTGKPSVTTNLQLAHIFDAQSTAHNYITNCIPKAARKRYEVTEVTKEISPWAVKTSTVEGETLMFETDADVSVDTEIKLEPVPESEVTPSEIEVYEEHKILSTMESKSDIPLDVNWNDVIQEYVGIVNLAKEYNSYCKKKLHEMEQCKLVDLNHFMEFIDLNTVHGFKIYKFVQKQLQLRRKLKDTIAVTDQMLSELFITGDPNSSLSVIESQKNRKYRPRIYDELFEEGISALDKLDT